MAVYSQHKKNLESLEKAREIVEGNKPSISSEFTPAYMDACFTVWYSAGKPNPRNLVKLVPDPNEYGIASSRPTERTLQTWVNTRFVERAMELDEAVGKQMSMRLIADKVQMLDQHAMVALEMQNMALTYLRENRDKLNANAAVRLLVEGVRIERESRGIPRTLEKMAERSDEELLKEIADALSRSEVGIYPLGDGIPVDLEDGGAAPEPEDNDHLSMSEPGE